VEYARWLGMNLPEDNDLLWIAREGLKTPLPEYWKPWYVHAFPLQYMFYIFHTSYCNACNAYFVWLYFSVHFRGAKP